MRLKITILFVILCIGSIGQAQGILSFLNNIEENQFLENETIQGRHILTIGGSAIASVSNAKMSLVKPFIFGGNISEEIKNENLSSFKKSNPSGFSLNSEIMTAHRTDEIFGKNTMLFFGIGYKNVGEFNFSEQHARLLLQGNQATVGKQIDLKDFQINAFDYGGVRLGFAKYVAKRDDFQHYYGFSFGYLKSFSHFHANVRSGSFYTQANGYDLFLDAQYTLQRSDTASLAFFKGQGMNASLFYGAKYKNRFGFNIGIEDLGYLKWKNALSSEKEIHHLFSGIELIDITQADEASSLSSVADSIRTSIVYPQTSEDYYMLLPMAVMMRVSYRFYKSFGAETYVRYFPNSIRNFEAMFKFNACFFNQSLRVSPFVYATGYGSISPGLELALVNKKRIYIEAGCYSLNFWQATLGGFATFGYKF
ncbi:MAG: hypothetical protein PHY85_10675 [Bacteroidales bacterium]|nr:hypothetical protein [Bacteroidales bacterium]